MFNNELKTMIYVQDVAAEKEFWLKMGFTITKEETILDYPSFEMQVSPEANTSFIVYSTEFVHKYSPDLVVNQPNLIFFTANIDMSHRLVSLISPNVSDLNEVPFRNFSFESPNGQFYTVREAF